MCGIVGIFTKDPSLEPELGALMAGMLASLCERGPDSAGFAIYRAAQDGRVKITVQSGDPDAAFPGLAKAIRAAIGADVGLQRRSTHAVLSVPSDRLEEARSVIASQHPDLRVIGVGDAIEI